MRDRRKGGFLLAAGVIFVAVSVFVKDSYYANILRSWGIAWAVIGFLRLREYFYYKKPEHQAEYEEKETVARINRTDERKVLLRQMAGHKAYQVMFFVLIVCPPACGMVGDRGAVPAVGIAVSSGDCLYEIL